MFLRSAGMWTHIMVSERWSEESPASADPNAAARLSLPRSRRLVAPSWTFAGRPASSGNACSIFWDLELKLLARLKA